MEDSKPEPFYASSQMNAALCLYVPTVLFLANTFRVGERLGLDLSVVTVDGIKGLVYAGGTLACGVLWHIKRIKAGKNPASDAPPIETPVATVKRLTSGAP